MEASVDEIKSYFTKQGELIPVYLDKILADLVKNNILSQQNYPAGACYSPVF